MKNLLLLVSVFFIIGCQTREDGAEYCENYINSFNNIEALEAGSIVDIETGCLMKFACFESVSEKDTKLLRIKYNDVNFKRKTVPSLSQSVISQGLLSVDLVSDKDFDATHPAGVSLSDLTSFLGRTPLPYLEKGFNGDMETIINKKLNELTVSELRLIASRFEIKILKEPTVRGVHKFKLIVTTDDNKVVEVPFEQNYK